ncbi:FAD/NAD(P)-binding domain-containing protein [Basidiobolus meristosporus CBS 931.73]|uniref:FAD/NAD(P)-binding domain-containing protein n=1 Tax=Basidiobolus meristosporus CBS 931.73 TaxID=1314790 RepID=A0A1Y1Z2J5_9FUNG|nr:FAD/NAD(P)-binding domain-containing protein [Basidiobolus meristosporus CBS 931.73]|eukprot:ORY04520.1 FAD/NAD(P)-binding domain-containing protein [Basidiobolus meristosporus CBS 931.73]
MTIKPITRVAIIGAGAAGLATAQSLNKEQHGWKVTIFEKAWVVGGTWNYEDAENASVHLPSTQPLGENSKILHKGGIYESLQTNIPIPVMAFKDFPFPEGTPLFPAHSVVSQYLRDFAEQQGILPSIKFNTEVLDVSWSEDKWTCVYTQQDGNKNVEDFDAVIVCNGHYTVPYLPDVPGLSDLISKTPGRVIHSRQYRKPDNYQGKSVLVIGGGYSALEIAREVSFHAKLVYQSITGKGRPVDTSDGNGVDSNKLRIVGKITKFDNETDSIYFDDGTTLDSIPDLIIFATGYLYSFPFLSQRGPENAKILSNGFSVHNIYEQVFYIPNPTLAFVGLPNKIAPFPLFQYQATWISKVLSRKVKLPSVEEMTQSYKQELAEWKGKKFHVFRTREVDYCNRISKYTVGAIAPVPEWWAEMRPKAHKMRVKELGH